MFAIWARKLDLFLQVIRRVSLVYRPSQRVAIVAIFLRKIVIIVASLAFLPLGLSRTGCVLNVGCDVCGA